MKKIDKSPFVSVIIPVKESSYYLLFETLPAIEKQTYKKFEVIVLPNQHSQYDLTLLKRYKWLKILPTGKVTRPAEKRNIGAKSAKGEIIAFIDDDAYSHERWLETASKLFVPKVGIVCGPGILPPNADYWEKVFDEVLKTWIGSGGYSYRFIAQKERYVDDYPSMNFLVKKNLFLQLGGFNGDYWPGEDSKLCEGIVYKKGKKILYHPAVTVYHHRRKDLRSFLEQHANYGFHRGAFFAHGDKNSRRFVYLIPTIFILYLIILLLSIIFSLLFPNIRYLVSSIFYLPLLIYVLGELYLFFLALLNTKNLKIAFIAPAVLFLTHFVYGIQFIRGYLVGRIKKENIYG